MKSIIALALAATALAAPGARLNKRSSVQGFDISSYQSSSYDFKSAYSDGARFVLIKATEGTDYISSAFSAQYDGATSAGFIRGAYHFAEPASSSGADQATYFHEHGGGWSGDGITLPGMLDIEYNPSGSTCYGLSQSDMTAWVKDFVDTYHSLTTRYPIIYSTADWWSQCTGNAADFSSTCPLDLADYNSSPGTIPGGWSFQTFWQNSDSYTYGGDSDIFNGSEDDLKKLATG
jgi:GH25 family lysozyme M1 (1,4-beta-N-acetylmuramidase)